MQTIAQIEAEAIASQTEATDRMLQEWVKSEGGDLERTVRWAARNMNFAGRKFWRAAINHAMREEG